MFHVFTFRPWKRTYATRCVAAATGGRTFEARVRGASTDTYASPCRSRKESVSARSSSSSHERWRNSTSGTSGSSSSRTPASSSFAASDFFTRGWYWSRIAAELPGQLERLERGPELRERALLLRLLVARHRLVRLHVEDELGRRALRPARGHVRVGQVVVRRVDLDRVEALGVVARAAPSRVETPRGYQAFSSPSSAKLQVPSRIVAGTCRGLSRLRRDGEAQAGQHERRVPHPNPRLLRHREIEVGRARRSSARARTSRASASAASPCGTNVAWLESRIVTFRRPFRVGMPPEPITISLPPGARAVSTATSRDQPPLEAIDTFTSGAP